MPRGGSRPFSGGARPGAGRPKKGQGMAEVPAQAAAAGKTPLQHMLDVMNDESADPGRRDRMAIAAAPYVHRAARTGQPGVKDQRTEAAKRASQGKFAPSAPPKLH